MTVDKEPNQQPPANPINHNIRIVHFVTGEHVVANFAQVKDPENEDKIIAYQLLFPLKLDLEKAGKDASGLDTFNIQYRRWNPFTPYEDHRVQISSVISALQPAEDILINFVNKLKEAGVDLSFLPNNGKDILGETDGEPTQEPTSAATEGPVATSEGGGD